MTIKFKEDGNGQFIRISLDEAGKETSKTASFSEISKPKTMGSGFYAEMKEWLKIQGNEIEPQYTTEELAQKEIDDLDIAEQSFESSVKTRLLEADKWELPSILILIDKTIEEVITYKQILRDMSNTHTTLEQYLNPAWPDKLTVKEFL